MSTSTVTEAPLKKKKRKSKGFFRIWLEFIPFWFLYMFIRMLPLKAAYALSSFLFKILFYIDKRHSDRSIKHILHAGITKDVNEATKIAMLSYNSFSKLLVEIIKLSQLYSPDKVKFTGNQDTIREVFGPNEKNINAIIITAHYGNWELAGSAWAEKTGIPMVSIMRPFGNPLIGKCILRNRESGIHQSVPKDGGIKGLMKALRAGQTIAILADQHAGSKEGVETLFFGQPCRTHSSPALLHLKTGVAIVPQLTRRVDDNFNFEFVVGEIIRYTPTDNKELDIKTVTQMYTTALEKLIAEQPEQWLWAHRRWLNLHRNK